MTGSYPQQNLLSNNQKISILLNTFLGFLLSVSKSVPIPPSNPPQTRQCHPAWPRRYTKNLIPSLPLDPSLYGRNQFLKTVEDPDIQVLDCDIKELSSDKCYILPALGKVWPGCWTTLWIGPGLRVRNSLVCIAFVIHWSKLVQLNLV